MEDKIKMEQSIDVLNLSTRTKNNLKYYGFNTIKDLKEVDIWEHPKFQMFSHDLRLKIKEEIQRFCKKKKE